VEENEDLQIKCKELELRETTLQEVRGARGGTLLRDWSAALAAAAAAAAVAAAAAAAAAASFSPTGAGSDGVCICAHACVSVRASDVGLQGPVDCRGDGCR
jgi:hypothetical protein